MYYVAQLLRVRKRLYLDGSFSKCLRKLLAVKVLARVAAIWRLDWSWVVHSQHVHSHKCYQETSDPYQVGLSIRVPECPYNMSPGLPRVRNSRDSQEEFTMFFYVLISDIAHSHFHHILFLGSRSLSIVHTKNIRELMGIF